ncbi:hypothetical protein PRNP1_010832 [Phytophthora ramorum]
MRTATDVSTDDLVNSLLNSVTSTSSDATDATSTSTSTSSASTSSSSASHSETSSSYSSSASSAATVAPKLTSPVTTSPTTTKPPTSSSASSETATKGTASSSDDDGGGGGGTALSIGIAIGVLALVVATLLFLRSRRRRAQKERGSAASPPAGATCLTVPADRGFKQERELGLPEMSIELPPGHLGFSKGLDMSYASSSARSSAASNNFSSSVASSTDSSVFNTQGGVSPTFDSRKMASYSYQYRSSSDGENAAASSSQRSNGSTTFHLTGLIGNGNTASNRGASADGTRGRKLSAPDEYAELVTATNAHGQMDMDAHSSKNQPQELHADFTTNQNGRSMGPAADNHSFLAPLPTRAPPMAVREPSVVRASEESMGPDSPVTGRGKRTGSVYDTLPKLSGEKMTASFVRPSEDEDPRGMSVASFLSESSISSTSTRDSAATSARGSAYVASMPLLQQLSSAEDSDYGEDLSSERASTDSTDSANMTRSGSLIAMNLDAKDGCSEIAI